jgi:uncharacterized protein YkwD/LysM repeat protein
MLNQKAEANIVKRRTVLLFVSFVAVMLGVFVFGRAQFIASARVTSGGSAQMREIFNRTNQLRLQVGRQPLRFNDALAAAAYEHAAYQVANVWWGHIRPDGSRPSDRAANAGYVGAIRCCGENYYMSIDATPDLVWNFWINSRDHYNNLVNEWYNDLGVAVATDGYRKSYVMVFGVGPAVPVCSAPIVRFDASVFTGVETGTITYTVQRGDTMGNIARSYGVTIESVARANNIANPDRLMPGDQLVIPGVAPLFMQAADPAPAQSAALTPAAAAQRTHTVAPGENLFRIALRYQTTVSTLSAANGISDPTRIYVGQVLTIPGAG